MKTKFLLGAMALPLFIAACSQEDIVNENSLTNLGERKTVDVTISLDEETMSRMAFVGGDTPYAWETGDQFGAALMDVPANGAAHPDYNVGFWSRFDLVDYIHTNYPFTRQSDGNWTSEAVMSEGNYFFYYPYNSNLGGRRSALKLEIPTEQVLADGAKATSALDQQLFVGYSSVQAKIGKEKESLTLKMEPLLAFPGFRLKSSGNSTEAITIRKIAYHSGTETFPLYYEVKPATAADEYDEDGNKTGKKTEFDAYTYENSIQSAATKRANIVRIAQEGGETNQVSLTFGKNGKTLKAGQSALGYIMLPPMTKSDAKLYIYTDKGLGIVELDEPHVDAGTAPTNIANDRALTTIAYNDNAIVNIEFDNTAFAQPFYLQVRSTDELVDLVKWSKNNTKAVLNAELIGNDIVLDPEVISVLKNSAKNGWDLTLNITGNQITVPSNTVNDALLTKLNLNVNTIIVEEGADIKLPALSGKYVDENKTTQTYAVELVKNYGTVELVGKTTAPDFYNAGTINISGQWNGEYYVADVADIENWGIVNVNADCPINTYYTGNKIAKLTNTYTGKANFNKGGTTVANITNAYYDNNYSVYKRGEIAVASGATLKGAGSNSGLIINNGTIEASLKNEADNKDRRSNGAFTIPSEIQNGGVVKGITNFGLVTMTSAKAHLQSANAINGYVNNNVESPYITQVTGETIFVEFTGTYKASEVAAKIKKTNSLQLRMSGVLNADPVSAADGGDDWSYIIGEQASLSVVADGDLTINGQVCFYSKNKTENTTFTVDANTVTDVNTGAYLWLGGGKLVVNGTLNILSGAVVKANVRETDEKDGRINKYGELLKVNAASSTTPSVPTSGYELTAGIYKVYTAEGFAEVAEGINDGTIENTAKIELANDINLNKMAWTPIGTKNIPFNGKFDGKGRTIYGLSVNVETAAGLFGWCQNNPVIKDVTIDGAVVTSNHYAGVVAGHIYGTISNCTVSNSVIVANYKNKDLDGDKAGAIAGFTGENKFKMTECRAENCTVTASRDAGQLVGIYYKSDVNKISDSYAVNVIVSWNKQGTGSNINNKICGREN